MTSCVSTKPILQKHTDGTIHLSADRQTVVLQNYLSVMVHPRRPSTRRKNYLKLIEKNESLSSM